jgi:hypothetical protein
MVDKVKICDIEDLSFDEKRALAYTIFRKNLLEISEKLNLSPNHVRSNILPLWVQKGYIIKIYKDERTFYKLNEDVIEV